MWCNFPRTVLLNITPFNSSSLRHDVVCRVLFTGASVKGFSLSFRNVFKVVSGQHPAIKGITVDVSLAQTHGIDAVHVNGPDIIKGCRSVHFIRQVDKIISKVCKSEEEKQLLTKICKEIQVNPCKEIGMKLFGWWDGSAYLKDLEKVELLIPFSDTECGIDVSHWNAAASWVKWWSANRLLIMLTNAYTTMSPGRWKLCVITQTTSKLWIKLVWLRRIRYPLKPS